MTYRLLPVIDHTTGALQASVSVLLTISYGVIATQWGLLDQASGKKVSTLCVKMFLPALLFSE